MVIKNSFEYARQKLGKDIEAIESKCLEVTPKLQEDYGDLNDCAITSISSLIEFYNHVEFNKLYDSVEAFAKSTKMYNNLYGTLPICLDLILKAMIKAWNLNLKSYFMYLKNLGFGFNTIKQLINGGTPLILSVVSANGSYYKYHAMIAKGYIIYRNTVTGKELKLLIMNDNWSKDNRFIDYDSLSTLSIINYLK